MSTTGNPLISIACTQCAAANARADKADVERDEAVAARATAERVSRAILEQASTYIEMAQELRAELTATKEALEQAEDTIVNQWHSVSTREDRVLISRLVAEQDALEELEE